MNGKKDIDSGTLHTSSSTRTRKVLVSALFLFIIFVIGGAAYTYRKSIDCLFIRNDKLVEPVITLRSTYFGCQCYHYKVDIFWTGDVMYSKLTTPSGLVIKTTKISTDTIEKLVSSFKSANFLCGPETLSMDVLLGRPNDEDVVELTLYARAGEERVSRTYVIRGAVQPQSRLGMLLAEIHAAIDVEALRQNSR